MVGSFVRLSYLFIAIWQPDIFSLNQKVQSNGIECEYTFRTYDKQFSKYIGFKKKKSISIKKREKKTYDDVKRVYRVFGGVSGCF